MKLQHDVIPFHPYPFLEGKRVKYEMWDGEKWVECDKRGQPTGRC